MIGKVTWISKVALRKGREQELNIQELHSTVQEKEREVMNVQQSEQMLQDETKQMQQQIDQLRLELQDGEAAYLEKKEMF